MIFSFYIRKFIKFWSPLDKSKISAEPDFRSIICFVLSDGSKYIDYQAGFSVGAYIISDFQGGYEKYHSQFYKICTQKYYLNTRLLLQNIYPIFPLFITM